MSENVEVVRGIYAAWLAGTSARGFMDPDTGFNRACEALEAVGLDPEE